MRDYLIHARPIKDITKQKIADINHYLKTDLKHDKFIQNLADSKDLKSDKASITKALPYCRQQIKKGNTHYNVYTRVIENLYKRFDMRYLNHIAHQNSGFQMLRSRFDHSGTTSFLQPSKFAKRNLAVTPKSDHNFMVNEDSIDRQFARETYFMRRNPGWYKKHIDYELKNIRYSAEQRPWKAGQVPTEIFRKDGDAMRILGITDDHYYNAACKFTLHKNPRAPKNTYHIIDTSMRDTTGDVRHDKVSPRQIVYEVNDFRRSHYMFSNGEDLKDIYMWNTEKMHRTTPNGWRPTNFSKYAHPRYTLINEYYHLGQIKNPKAQMSVFLGKYPKFADQMHLNNGMQAQENISKLLADNEKDYRDDEFSQLGLGNEGKHNILVERKKYKQFDLNKVYSTSDIYNSKKPKPVSLSNFRKALLKQAHQYNPYIMLGHQLQKATPDEASQYLNNNLNMAKKLKMFSGKQIIQHLKNRMDQHVYVKEAKTGTYIGIDPNYKGKLKGIKPNAIYNSNNYKKPISKDRAVKKVMDYSRKETIKARMARALKEMNICKPSGFYIQPHKASQNKHLATKPLTRKNLKRTPKKTIHHNNPTIQ